MDMANELLDAIDILVNQTMNNKFTQIYSGICKSVVDSSTCVMTVNGKDNNVTFYGVRPKTGNIYRVFIPNGNMSMAFIVTIPTTYGEVGAAPDGFGLGGGANFIASGDLNNYKYCGWYAWDAGVANTPFNYGSCIILNKGSQYIAYQIAIAGFDKNICIRRYYFPDNKWGEWEYVNPPMALGVEYRTTERYQEKPVYVKAINFGALPNATSKTVEWGSNNVRPIRYSGRTETAGRYAFPYAHYIQCAVSGNSIIVYTTANYSAYTASFAVYYTKDTD